MTTTRFPHGVERRADAADKFGIVAALLGSLTVAAVYADGWAHVNLGGLEGFFTPWHGALYTAFALLSAWILWATWLRRRDGGSLASAIPAGYGVGLVGIIVFALGGVFDMVWHIAFGVETGIEALISPTHLMLLLGGSLLLWSPARATIARTAHTLPWSGVVAGATVGALAGFFLSYLSVFSSPQATKSMTTIPEGAPGHLAAEMPPVAGMGGYLVITVLLVVTIMSLWRLGNLPPGSATLVVFMVAVPASALTEFTYGPAALGAVIATFMLEMLVRKAPGRFTPRVQVTLLPGFVWAGQLTGLAIRGQLGWPVEMWAGAILLTMLAGAAIGQLVDGSIQPPRGTEPSVG